MRTRYDVYRRLEPTHPFEDLSRAFRAEVHDPAWFLAKQWLMGEHQGEDASTPVEITYEATHDAIDPFGGDARWDPKIVPPEAVIESEPGDWWTPGRRISIGITAGAGLTAVGTLPPNDPLRAHLLSDLPPPYDDMNGRGYDGQKLYASRNAMGLPAAPFANVPNEPVDLWDPEELVYTMQFTCRGTTLTLERHDGGHVDWYSTDADQPIPPPVQVPAGVVVYPTPLEYPGAPHPRWWQIEDAQVDIGGYAPDRSHFATLLLLELVVSHSDDWFLFPLNTHAGHVVTLQDVRVKDSFDDEYPLNAPTNWSLFKVRGLQENALVVWPSVASTLTGQPIEDVTLGIEEDVNRLWAVEHRLDGRDVDPSPPTIPPAAAQQGLIDGSTEKTFGYLPSTRMAHHWHPYRIEQVAGNRRRFVQERLADLNQNPPQFTPGAKARVLRNPNAVGHRIEPATIPSTGLRLRRRWMLARQTDGKPLLWMQRRRWPLLGPPASDLRFDQFEDIAPTV